MFEFIAGMLLIPAVFYISILVCFLAIALGIDNDKGDGWGWATIGSAGLAVIGASYFGITLEAIKAAPSMLAVGAGIYIVLGILWSFAKWYFKLSNVRDTYLELKAKYAENGKLPADFLKAPMAEEDCQSKDDRQAREETYGRNRDFFSYVNSRMQTYVSTTGTDIGNDPTLIGQTIKPLATRHKSSITQWIAFWPISFTWTMINDPVRKIANYIFSRIKGTFQKMSDAMFAGV